MMGLYSSNSDLLAALCILAPEGNVRVALVGLIEFLEDTAEDIVFDRRAIFECIAQGVVNGFVTTTNDDWDDGREPEEPVANVEEALRKFRSQLGMNEDGDE